MFGVLAETVVPPSDVRALAAVRWGGRSAVAVARGAAVAVHDVAALLALQRRRRLAGAAGPMRTPPPSSPGWRFTSGTA